MDITTVASAVFLFAYAIASIATAVLVSKGTSQFIIALVLAPALWVGAVNDLCDSIPMDDPTDENTF